MSRNRIATGMLTVALTALPGAVGWRMTEAKPAEQATTKKAPDPKLVERGKYLVSFAGCHDCHTPFKMGPTGPEPDMTKALTGHPQEMKLPPAPKLPEGPWVWIGAGTNTAFAGPWGVSFTANLTPDPETGLGKWTEEMFIQAIRTGRKEGKGRPILPPMPWPMYRNMTDEDLKSVFAYLQTMKPVVNKVPDPVDPPEAGAK